MKIHYLQHVPFETPEQIAVWANNKGYPLTGTHQYANDPLPSLSDIDMLVILGGPMGVYDEEQFPWLVEEKRFIQEAIHQQKLVLGICLGAQLIAEVIGGTVKRNPHKEIGWHPVKLTEEASRSSFFNGLPEQFVPFHWHGDTFELPVDAARIAFSDGCANQAFEYGGHVVGLQFHLESSNGSIRTLIEHCSNELDKSLYVQCPYEMVDQTGALVLSNEILFTLLNAMESSSESSRPS